MGSAIKEGIVTKEMVELCGTQIRLTTPMQQRTHRICVRQKLTRTARSGGIAGRKGATK